MHVLTGAAGYIDAGGDNTDTLGRGLGPSEFDKRKKRKYVSGHQSCVYMSLKWKKSTLGLIF